MSNSITIDEIQVWEHGSKEFPETEYCSFGTEYCSLGTEYCSLGTHNSTQYTSRYIIHPCFTWKDAYRDFFDSLDVLDSLVFPQLSFLMHVSRSQRIQSIQVYDEQELVCDLPKKLPETTLVLQPHFTCVFTIDNCKYRVKCQDMFEE